VKVGIFDSGVGGKSVANAIQKQLPELEIIFRNDSQHVPYGTRQPQEILGFVVPILQAMVDEGCQVIVVACNTVSTTLIKQLRQKFNVPLIAIDPMVKPAASLTKSGVIAVCATPTTLASQRYTELKKDFAKNVKILEPDCGDWSSMVEAGQVDQRKIATRIKFVLDAGADVIVLACTHYHWIEDEIKQLASGRAQVLQPEEAVIRQLKRVLSRLG
jgi:glutamate racemase